MMFFCVKQSTAYEMRISYWSSDVCSSDLGTVGFNESRTSHVHVRARGWIERLHARVEGETVTKGQLLLEFFSPELITAAFEFVRELQRGNPNTTEIARRKLRALGVADRQIEDIRQNRQVPERIQVFAPRAGAVTQARQSVV